MRSHRVMKSITSRSHEPRVRESSPNCVHPEKMVAVAMSRIDTGQVLAALLEPLDQLPVLFGGARCARSECLCRESVNARLQMTYGQDIVLGAAVSILESRREGQWPRQSGRVTLRSA